jgi:cellobiose phosphorylase
LKGIRIDPNIPKHWKEAKVTRKYQEKTLHIHISNPKGLNNGVEKITINGSVFDGKWIDVKQFTEQELGIKVLLG